MRRRAGRWPAPDAEVFLLGDEAGAAETARELGIRHVAEVERTGEGPKKLWSFFDAAQRMARHELVCYATSYCLRIFCRGERGGCSAWTIFDTGAAGVGREVVEEGAHESRDSVVGSEQRRLD